MLSNPAFFPAGAAAQGACGTQSSGQATWPSSRAGAVLTIDLGAVAFNYRHVAHRASRSICAAVVKADAYGLGAARVAPALEHAGARQFFVAHVDEGLALRQHVSARCGVTVLHGPRPDAVADCLAHGLRPVLNSLEQIGWVRDAARKRGQAVDVALQLDTGMSRFGLAEAELRRVAGDPALLEGLSVSLIMSHLACADNPADPANAMQAARLRDYAALLPPAPLSLAASSGVFLGPDYHFDLVRPGAALYGVAPNMTGPNPLRQVVRLQAHVLQTRALNKGDRVGYGLTWQAQGPCRVATISVGYADGFARQGAGTGCVWFRGVRLPILGRISMDSMTVDISHLPQGQLEADGMVDLLNETYGVDAVGAAEGTIGYEVLTSLGRRYHRIYADNPAP
ncbi:alanine racemase [Acetobacter sp. TBRC 12305]|uniref:Alanine racemase n=1 Tax=Acetobacter garciniae TaxID=2817435 RepID=A0A939HHW4_9PROT|nr:alanine racemase [Acetobacter garciniae]MBO1324703.1 alanine racemase [Acetobacter garciniae]MBX0344393.1 alanine racemase [Acetobacter garciniae]